MTGKLTFLCFEILTGGGSAKFCLHRPVELMHPLCTPISHTLQMYPYKIIIMSHIFHFVPSSKTIPDVSNPSKTLNSANN